MALDDADGLGPLLLDEPRAPKRCLNNLLDLLPVRCELGGRYGDTGYGQVNDISQVEEALQTLLFRFDGKGRVDRSSVNGTVLQGRNPKQALAHVDDFDIPIRIEPQIPHGHAGQIVDSAA